MHEQEFERSVQQKMEELSFSPSARVWKDVEQEIRDRKERRRVIFWLLPVGLMLALGGWWIFYPGDANLAGKPVSEHKIEVNTNQERNISGPATSNSQQDASAAAPRSVEPQKENERGNTKSGKDRREIVNATTIASAQKLKRESFKNWALQQVQTRASKQRNSFAANVQQPEQANNFSGETAGISQTAAATQPIPINLAQAAAKQLPHAPGPLQEWASTLKKDIARSKKQNWKWGIQVQYGRSSIGQGLSLGGVTQDRAAADPLMNNGSGNNFFGSVNQQSRNSDFISGGFTVQKKLTGGWSVRTGLAYSRYGQQVRVGEAVPRSILPTSVGRNEALASSSVVYRPTGGTGGWYNNRYHQLSVPVVLQVQPSRAIPLEIVGGMQLGYLVGGRELRYDTTAKLYYPARPEQQRVQLSLQAGIQYRIATGRRYELLGGPHLNYHLTRLDAAHTGRQRHLYAYQLGLQLRKK